MSDQAATLTLHVEDQEVWRQVLASLAGELMAKGFSLERFLAEGEPYLLGFLNAMLGDFANFAGPQVVAEADAFFQSIGLQAGFDATDADAILAEAVSRLAGDAEGLASETTAAFSRWVEGLRRAGMTDENILAALNADTSELATVLGPWYRGIADMGRNFAKIVDETAQQAIEEAVPVDETNRGSYWITMHDGKVCGQHDTSPERSCARRHGLLKPFAEWVALGLPGSGVTYCRGNCRCMLVTESYLKDGAPANPVDSSEAIQRAQDRATRQHAKVVEYAAARGEEYQTGFPTTGIAEQLRRARSRTARQGLG